MTVYIYKTYLLFRFDDTILILYKLYIPFRHLVTDLNYDRK